VLPCLAEFLTASALSDMFFCCRSVAATSISLPLQRAFVSVPWVRNIETWVIKRLATHTVPRRK